MLAYLFEQNSFTTRITIVILRIHDPDREPGTLALNLPGDESLDKPADSSEFLV